MAAQKGRELLLKIDTGSGFETVGGFKTNELDINSDTVDITSKDSAGFKELLAGAGTTSFSVSGDGVFVSDNAFNIVHTHMLNRTHPDCQIIIPGLATYEGPFAISSLRLTGAEGDAITYNISLESAGSISVTPV
ncbi:MULTISPECIES: phage major tail protein, TP901-1 family [Kordiimonas]|uniref:phage major tail protein, TP901-1 family n=1 Tax=Kordiimonas TaxID=288021 RepID=UPI001FF5B729|nr:MULTISPECIES: phage major tail protein, TP901-1 family [Kordiimonas]MCK0068034.1 phage major tail protein, TP901-1 family [Kordiimonas laminariae]UTW59989.1 phage major tail protein, TP901-1 family [Kordiimonas sp. SCSIO 12603]